MMIVTVLLHAYFIKSYLILVLLLLLQQNFINFFLIIHMFIKSYLNIHDLLARFGECSISVRNMTKTALYKYYGHVKEV